MILVKFRKLNRQGEDETVGRIEWDGNEMKAFPEDSEVLNRILQETFHCEQVTGNLETKLSAKDGMKFLRALQYRFKNVYFQASRPLTPDEVADVPEPQERGAEGDPGSTTQRKYFERE
jgi:hypothetical protein